MFAFLSRPLVLLTTLYAFAWGPMLFMRGVYWDGWVYFSQYLHPDYVHIWETEFGPQRLHINYELFRLVALSPDPVLLARAITFCSWLIAGLLIYRVLRKAFNVEISTAFLVSAYYLVAPIFLVRFEIIHAFYSIANVLFVAGCYLYLVPPQVQWKKFFAEFTAIILFITAFFVNSFAVFFFGFLAAHTYISSRGTSIAAHLKMYVIRYFYLCALPFLFLSFKFTYLKPYGASASYNEPIIFREGASILSIASITADGVWSGIWTGLVWPLGSSLMLLERKFFAAALLLALTLVALLLYRMTLVGEQSDIRISRFSLPQGVMLLLVGFVFIILALVPYVAVGKPPHIYGYGFGLRHTLLFPLGTALLIFGTVRSLVREKAQKSVHIAFLSLFAAFIWYNVFLLDMDWYKQRAILHELPPVIANMPKGTVVIFNDTVRGLNWNDRDIGRQEYDGFLTYLTGLRSNFGISAYDFETTTREHELRATSTLRVRVFSKRSDDPKVTDWIPLKLTELFGNNLDGTAQKRLQIFVERESL